MTDIEREFLEWWHRLADGPEPEFEYPFHHERRWRFDFAFPFEMVAVELEGGIWNRGRHVRGKGFRGDAEKYNMAAELGWRVFRFTADMLRDDPKGCIDQIMRALGA